MSKTYSEMLMFNTAKERFEYLKLEGSVGQDTFGFDRYLNQALYNSSEWKRVRDKVIVRDEGCDMGLIDKPIAGKILVHHINPITKEDVLKRSSKIFDIDNLVCVSLNTHNAIHYGYQEDIGTGYVERKPNDTCPWKGKKR